MGWRRTLSLSAIVLLNPVAVWALPGLRTAPSVQIPVGIESRGTTLPGQRLSAPIFGYPPPVGVQLNSNAQAPIAAPAASPAAPPSVEPDTTVDLPEPKPLADVPQPKPIADVPDPSPSPALSRPVENPFDTYSKELKARSYVPESLPLVPDLMEAPASLMASPTPVTPGFNLGTLHRGCDANPFPAGIPGMPGAGCPPPCKRCGPGGSCGSSANGCPACAPPEPYWFGAVGALYMGRTSPNQVWLSQQRSDPSNRLMSGADAAVPWTAGWEASIGRILPGRGGVQLTYWGLAPTSAFASVRLPGDLGTPINFCNFDIGGICAGDFFDMVDEHRVWRRNEVNNVELNFFSGSYSSPIGACQISWLAGVRYFRFRDQLIFGAVEEGFEFGDNGGADEAYVNVATNNNLIGAQIGAWANCPVGSRLGVFLFPRVGVYANQANQHYQIYRGDGVSAADFNSSKTSGSLLAQIDLGISYSITPLWSAYLGYRVVAVSGVGLADNQLPATMITTPNVAAINSNGDLILQGGTAGMLWRF